MFPHHTEAEMPLAILLDSDDYTDFVERVGVLVREYALLKALCLTDRRRARPMAVLRL